MIKAAKLVKGLNNSFTEKGKYRLAYLLLKDVSRLDVNTVHFKNQKNSTNVCGHISNSGTGSLTLTASVHQSSTVSPSFQPDYSKVEQFNGVPDAEEAHWVLKIAQGHLHMIGYICEYKSKKQAERFRTASSLYASHPIAFSAGSTKCRPTCKPNNAITSHGRTYLLVLVSAFTRGGMSRHH